MKSTADAQAVSKALNAVYRPWLESAAEHLQTLAEKGPLPGHDGQPLEELLVEPGGMVLVRRWPPVRHGSTSCVPDAGQELDGDLCRCDGLACRR